MTASQLRARERRMPEHIAVGQCGCATWALLAPLVGTRTMTKAEPNKGPKTERNGFASGINIRFALVSLFLIGLLLPTVPAFGENARDWITGLPREPIHVQALRGERRSRSASFCMLRFGVLGTAPTSDRTRLPHIRPF